jgi:hypothetical protein
MPFEEKLARWTVVLQNFTLLAPDSRSGKIN